MDYILIVAAAIVTVIVIVLTILYFKCKEDPYNAYMYITESPSHRVTKQIDWVSVSLCITYNINIVIWFDQLLLRNHASM